MEVDAMTRRAGQRAKWHATSPPSGVTDTKVMDAREPTSSLDRWGWWLAGTVLGSLALLAVLYLADPDPDRQRQNIPVFPDDLGIRDPLYVVLWCLVGVGVLLMLVLLGREFCRSRSEERRVGKEC